MLLSATTFLIFGMLVPGSLKGLVRLEPMMVPPLWMMSSVSLMVRGMRLPSMMPRQPSSTPTVSTPSL